MSSACAAIPNAPGRVFESPRPRRSTANAALPRAINESAKSWKARFDEVTPWISRTGSPTPSPY